VYSWAQWQVGGEAGPTHLRPMRIAHWSDSQEMTSQFLCFARIARHNLRKGKKLYWVMARMLKSNCKVPCVMSFSKLDQGYSGASGKFCLKFF